ncbi:Nup85 nucleoporin-domain-containing protein [Fennellomyces sp. T-0311]|nr:Nup85 nucleoporin-domain-containing protein [Fennellomyces sp. T-0311]
MGKSKKNAARAVPPSKQNPVGSFDRSSSPSSEEYEKVEKSGHSDDTANWTKVSSADSGTDDSQQYPRSPRESNSQAATSSESEADQAKNKKRMSTSKQSAADSDPGELSLVFGRLSELKEGAPTSRQEFYRHAYEIFANIEQINMGSSSPFIGSGRKSEIISCAHEYNTLLLQYFDWLNQNGGDKDEKSYIYKLMRIWDLCERLNFSENDNDVVVNDLVTWLNLYPLSEESSPKDLQRYNSFDSDDEELVIVDRDDISNRSGDDDQEESGDAVDWMHVRRNLLRGNVEEATQILKGCVDSLSLENQGCLHKVIRVAETMPPLPAGSSSSSTTQAAWYKWAVFRRQMADELERFDCSSCDRRVRKEINVVLKILCGDEKVISKAGTFLESFVGLLIYTDPFRSRKDIPAIAERSLSDEDDVVAACYALLLHDWDGVFSAFDDLWLQTHMGHALISAGIMPSGDLPASSDADHEECINPVYHIMNAYANTVAHEFNMWEEAVGYVSGCRTNREFWAKQLLKQRIDSTTDTDALKAMLEGCEKYHFSGLKKMLCKVLAEKYEEQGQMRDATINYARAGDIVSLDKLADTALRKYLDSGILEEVIAETDDTRDAIQKSTHYRFLSQYQRLRTLLHGGRLGEAADLIKQLLSSIDAPAEFQVILLIDSLSILEDVSKSVIFNENETLDLMRRLQSTQKNKDLHANVFAKCYNRVRPDTVVSNDEVVIKISQSLAFNLANALIAQ